MEDVALRRMLPVAAGGLLRHTGVKDCLAPDETNLFKWSRIKECSALEMRGEMWVVRT